MGDEPQTSKTGLRYHRPISVHHPEFTKTVVSYQLSVAKTELALRARPVVFFDYERK